MRRRVLLVHGTCSLHNVERALFNTFLCGRNRARGNVLTPLAVTHATNTAIVGRATSHVPRFYVVAIRASDFAGKYARLSARLVAKRKFQITKRRKGTETLQSVSKSNCETI